jgi:chorismate mutase
MEISEWRKKIDELETEIVRLLSLRSHYALKIGESKKKIGKPIYDPEREAEILQRLVSKNPGPLSDKALQQIFLKIMEETRNLESENSHEG